MVQDYCVTTQKTTIIIFANITRMIKSRWTKTGHVGCTEVRRNAYVLIRKPDDRSLENPCTDGIVLLKWILKI